LALNCLIFSNKPSKTVAEEMLFAEYNYLNAQFKRYVAML